MEKTVERFHTPKNLDSGTVPLEKKGRRFLKRPAALGLIGQEIACRIAACMASNLLGSRFFSSIDEDLFTGSDRKVTTTRYSLGPKI